MKRTAKPIFIVLFSLFTPFFAFSQNWEVGVFAGGSNYYGDVANDFHVKNIRYGFSGFVRKHLSQRFVLRGNIGYVKIVGLDSISSDPFQQNRNLNFFTDIYEFSGQLEYNFVDDKTRGRRIKNYTIPYIFAGIGASYFVPQTIYQGNTYNLADLQTSGINYSQVAIVIPVGAGVRYYLTHHWQIGFEFGARFTSTSDLDDIRGNSVYPDPADLPSDESRLVHDRSDFPKDDQGVGFGVPGTTRGKIDYITDMYFVYGITFSYKIGLFKGSRFHGKAVHCPRFY